MPVWADGGYIDASLLGWAMETLSFMLEIVGRTDDVKGFRVPFPHNTPERGGCVNHHKRWQLSG